MRIVFIGKSDACIQAAKSLKKHGHEVVMIEQDKAVIEELSKQIDCSFLQGDGSKPDILREVNPQATDILFCFSSNDQVNIIASLVGRSIGFKRIITRIEDVQYENVCMELGLNEIMIPSRMIGRDIEAIVQGTIYADSSTTIKNDARLFLFIFEGEKTAVKDIPLPSKSKIICYYTDGALTIAEEDSKLRQGDEVVVLTASQSLPALKERFKSSKNGSAAPKTALE